ncbi:hypothetical protein [Chryseobacterium sp. MMS23-Vi53]|uniref:hypothetical protein n=1 Tax=Chryseobacterium sp. MMS23-Vi53 TaxID=3386644 RepID=UPI0039EC8FE5
MKKKIIVFTIFLIIILGGYFTLYHKDKELKFIPRNADAVILLDTKNATRQYLLSFLSHPSEWFKGKGKKENTISIQESGVKIPDFLQIFHLENTKTSEWYSVVELDNKQKFLEYLKQEKFINKGKDLFQKDNFFIKIEYENCILGTSSAAFENIIHLFLAFPDRTNFSSEDFIDNSLGSISFVSKGKIQNFSINLNEDNIQIKNNKYAEKFSSILSKLEKTKSFAEVELDQKNIKKLTSFWDKTFADSSQINFVKSSIELEQVSDTIITYGYDDNFNEIEKKSVQKNTQPDYVIDFTSLNNEKTEKYFLNKKWINAQKQFTAIPFQPNLIEKTGMGFQIKSTRKSIGLSLKLNENYIFVRNNQLLSSSLKTLSTKEKKILSDLDYVFYGNNNSDYYIKLQFKKSELPLILRW